MKSNTIIAIISLVSSTVIGVAGVIIESKKQTEISNEDKQDIAERPADEVIKKLSKLELEPSE